MSNLKTFFFVCIAIISNCLASPAERIYEWVVVGGGSAGASVIGVLLDCCIDGKSIMWIDPAFSGGALGADYQNVPSNGKAKYFKNFFNACRSFGMRTPHQPYKLFSYDDECFCVLRDVVEPLLVVTDKLLQHVASRKGFVQSIQRAKENLFLLDVNEKIIKTKRVVLAHGCQPKTLHYPLACITLPDALNKERLSKLVTADDTIAVFGTSHSGILVLKNLCEVGVRKIISIGRKPLCFMEERDGYYFHDNTGLKGVAAQWARDVFQNSPPSHLIKIMNPDNKDCSELIKQCTKVIYAIGFERSKIDGFTNELLNKYDPATGIIAPRLFGIGFAFPERVRDDSGDDEYAVGLWDFVDYAQRNVPLWIKEGDE